MSHLEIGEAIFEDGAPQLGLVVAREIHFVLLGKLDQGRDPTNSMI